MDDLISRSALIKKLEETQGKIRTPDMKFVLSWAINLLNEQPAVDAIEVVRCRDCKHHEDEDLKTVYCPNIVGGWVDYDFYCRDGKEKSNEEG